MSFAEKIDYFRRKINVPTNTYRDILRDEHDHAFMVAGAAKWDLIQDLREAVAAAIENGETLDQFRARFKQITQDHGWVNYTGSGSKGGVNWRTKIIYQTNMRTAYAAGRWAQMTDPDVLAARPYWRYVHTTKENPRINHKGWHNAILPADDPWWNTHFAPNGYNCRCRVESIGKNDLGKYGKTKPDSPPPDGVGEIGEGFNYAPGRSVASESARMALDKLAKLSPDLAARAAGNPVIMKKIWAKTNENWQKYLEKLPKNKPFTVGVLNYNALKSLYNNDIFIQSAAIQIIDSSKFNANLEILPDLFFNPTDIFLNKQKNELIFVRDDISVTVEYAPENKLRLARARKPRTLHVTQIGDSKNVVGERIFSDSRRQ